jgi:SAM-dependent methyltransferase
MTSDDGYAIKLAAFNGTASWQADANAAIARLAQAEWGSLLDIGCGTGAFAALVRDRFPGRLVVGIDAGPYAARETVADIARWRSSSMFDAAVMLHSANHIDLAAAAENIGSLVRPGGRLVVVSPNPTFVRIVRALNDSGQWPPGGGDATAIAYRSAAAVAESLGSMFVLDPDVAFFGQTIAVGAPGRGAMCIAERFAATIHRRSGPRETVGLACSRSLPETCH